MSFFLCAPLDPNEAPGPETTFLINIIAGVTISALVLLFLVVLVTYVTTKRITKKRLGNLSSEQCIVSQDSCKVQ